ncbi:LysR substrate-binding domain-containing protein [Hydrogenophaga sp. UC242_50]
MSFFLCVRPVWLRRCDLLKTSCRSICFIPCCVHKHRHYGSAPLVWRIPPRQRGITLANAALCYQAAADGLGFAMAQRAYVEEDLRIGRLVVAANHVARTELGYYLVCDPMKATTTPVRLFRDWIRSVR